MRQDVCTPKYFQRLKAKCCFCGQQQIAVDINYFLSCFAIQRGTIITGSGDPCIVVVSIKNKIFGAFARQGRTGVNILYPL